MMGGKGCARDFEFDHTNKCYGDNTKSTLENEAHKIIWDFEIQNGSANLSQMTRHGDVVMIYKK